MEVPPFSDHRPSMDRNVLLVTHPVGHAAKSTHTLPDSDFRYGIRTTSNGSVKDCLSGWDTEEDKLSWKFISRSEIPESARRFHGKQDFIATNKLALKDGCVTSRDFREFKEANRDIIVKLDDNGEFEREYNRRVRIKNMRHGIPTPLKSEISDCLTYRPLHEAIARAWRKKEIQNEIRKARKKAKPTFQTASRSTKASRGHTFKGAPPPTLADTFKLKRFTDITRHKIVDHW